MKTQGCNPASLSSLCCVRAPDSMHIFTIFNINSDCYCNNTQQEQQRCYKYLERVFYDTSANYRWAASGIYDVRYPRVCVCVCAAYKLMSIWTLWGLITRFLLAANSREPGLTRALIGRLLPHVYRRILVRYVTCGAREERRGEEEEEEEEEGCGIWEWRCVEFIHLSAQSPHTRLL